MISIRERSNDRLIRIFDPNMFHFYVWEEHELQFDFFREFGLYYSNGYLVLATDKGILVWELIYDDDVDDTRKRVRAIHFSRQILDNVDACKVAGNGKIYILSHGEPQRRPHQMIKVYDISTGNILQTVRCNNIPACQYLVLTASQNHLLLVHDHCDDDGIFAFDVKNGVLGQSPASSLSGSDFGVSGMRLFMWGQTVIQTNDGYILDKDKNFPNNSFRMISIDDNGILRVVHPVDDDYDDIPLALRRQDAGIPLALRVLHAQTDGPVRGLITCTDNRFFIPGSRNILNIDEFRFHSNRKIRTLSTGLGFTYSDYFCTYFHDYYVLSNDTAIVCIIPAGYEGNFVIQRFLVSK
jgi:hypothetical protein